MLQHVLAGAKPRVRPAPVRCELSKIDPHLLEGHWRDARDLAELLPWLQSFVGFSTSAAPEVSNDSQFAEPRDNRERSRCAPQ